MPKQYFENFEVGETVESKVARTISESDLYTIAGCRVVMRNSTPTKNT